MSFNDDHALETYKSLITISVEVVKTLLYLNGGAIVALLAYVGQAQNGPAVAKNATWTLIWFVVGLALSVVAFIGSYMTQLSLYQESVHSETYKGKHQRWLIPSIIIGVLSLIAFTVGAFCGIAALSNSL